MGQKSAYLEKHFLDETFSNTAKPSRATLYFALFTTSPTTSSDTGVEVTGGSYARVGVTNNATNFPAATKTGSAAAKKQNASVVTFPAATADWGTVIAFGIYDASTSGNLLYWGAVNPSIDINNGTTYTIRINALTITEK